MQSSPKSSRKLFITTLIAVLIVTLSSVQAQEATFPRHPAVSPDGKLVAFCYAGDIWSVSSEGGRAVRLTVNPAYEHTPRWSPDGEWIAFSADREGNDDIYIIPAAGGQSKQLTWHESRDMVCDWCPDGSAVIFTSRRDDRYSDLDMLYRVPVEGGTPVPIMEAWGTDAAISPDGKQVLYTRSGKSTSWWRRHYHGSASPQVWIYEPESGKHTTVTDTGEIETGDDFQRTPSRWPLWGRNGAYYITAEPDDTPNIYRRNIDGTWRKITDYTGDGVRFPTISHNGLVIAYEYGLDIYLIEDEAEPRKLEIIAPLDNSGLSPEPVKYSGKAEKLAFTPDGKQLFIEVRGEVFANRIVGDDDKAARSRANSLSGNNPARDGDFTVSSGGDSIIFVSDRSGNRDLYLVYSDDAETPELSRCFSLKTEQLTDNPKDEHSPRWSPDGSKVAFIRGMGDLIILDIESGKEQILLEGWSLDYYRWSPDSKWIAYSREDDNFNSDVFVIPADGGRWVNVSRHPDNDDFPVWSGNGAKLAFRSQREGNKPHLHMVYLRLEDHYKSSADWAEERRKPKSDKRDKDAKKDEEVKDKDEDAVEVIIDTTDIYRRIRTVTAIAEGGEIALSPDGRKYAYVSDHQGDRDLYIIDGTTKDVTRLTKGGENPRSISFDKKGDRIRYFAGKGKVKSVGTDGKKTKSHPFDAAVLVQWTEERRQKFGEIWRTLNDRFYDSDFHGKDWNALGEKYRGLIDAASHERDFGDLVNQMFGEINASHMGYRPSGMGNGKSTGRLGLDFDFTASGPGYTVKHIQPYSPCVKISDPVQVGERLIAINGVKLNPGVNLHKLLQDQVNQRTELLIADAKGKKERKLIVQPMGAWIQGWLRYDEWVSDRRALVDSLSKGKLGYIHLRGMGDQSLSRFEAQLFSQADGKDGLVIDVRYNGGGWTTDYILAMLQVKRHAVTFPRDGGPGYPQGRLPMYCWVEPVTVLCNEYSFSNAEILSHAIKTLERGKLVGVPTPGGVISTGGNRLLDGSGFRIPLRGWYQGTEPERDAKRNMEGNGAVPDRIIRLNPDQISPEDDIQLIGATEDLIRELEQ
ncbi:MAG: PD40 domain-containing protein [Calditrichaeota bacterium]|nr:PD40 domain-containing protein [Calditrichota bacterium]